MVQFWSNHICFVASPIYFSLNEQFQRQFPPSAALKKHLPDVFPEKLLHLRRGEERQSRRGVFSDNETPWNELKYCFDDFNISMIADMADIYDNLPHKKMHGHIKIDVNDALPQDQKLITWADCYAVTQAKEVWHTPSNFSESALRVSRARGSRICGPHQGVINLDSEFQDTQHVRFCKPQPGKSEPPVILVPSGMGPHIRFC